MAIPARASAPRIRLAGQLSPARWWLIGVCETMGTPADSAVFRSYLPASPRVRSRGMCNASTLFAQWVAPRLSGDWARPFASRQGSIPDFSHNCGPYRRTCEGGSSSFIWCRGLADRSSATELNAAVIESATAPKPSIALALAHPTRVDAGVTEPDQQERGHETHRRQRAGIRDTSLINFLRRGTVPDCGVPKGSVISVSVF